MADAAVKDIPVFRTVCKAVGFGFVWFDYVYDSDCYLLSILPEIHCKRNYGWSYQVKGRERQDDRESAMVEECGGISGLSQELSG